MAARNKVAPARQCANATANRCPTSWFVSTTSQDFATATSHRGAGDLRVAARCGPFHASCHGLCCQSSDCFGAVQSEWIGFEGQHFGLVLGPGPPSQGFQRHLCIQSLCSCKLFMHVPRQWLKGLSCPSGRGASLYLQQ